MRILAINGSPRKGMSTCFALEQALNAAKAVSSEIETELIELGGLDIRYCIGCNRCREPLTCVHDDDFMKLLPKLTQPDIGGIIIGTPVYMGAMTGLLKNFLDRTVMLRRAKFLWQNIVAGTLAVGAARNGGQELANQAVQNALFAQNMVLVSDGPKFCHYGATLSSGLPGGIESDEFGLTTARNLGQRVAELALKLHGRP
jgi:multimeric flavodoxin WrbA